jgi:hypothetical protein
MNQKQNRQNLAQQNEMAKQNQGQPSLQQLQQNKMIQNQMMQNQGRPQQSQQLQQPYVDKSKYEANQLSGGQKTTPNGNFAMDEKAKLQQMAMPNEYGNAGRRRLV